MYQNCKLGGLLTFQQFSVLRQLEEYGAKRGMLTYWLPRDLGAYRSSAHTHILNRLVELKYVERNNIAKEGAKKPKYAYRITQSGKQTWAEFKDLASIPANQILGAKADYGRLAFAQRLLR